MLYEVFSNTEGRLNREGPFLMDVLSRGPGKRVADIACGTGLHALFFAEHGARVHAYDISEGMIEHAQSVRPHEHVEYAVHDMREPLPETFDLVLCTGNSLSLLTSVEDLRRCFAAVYDALSGGGRFLAQVLNYASPGNQKVRTRVEERTVNDSNVVAVKCLAPRGKHTYLTLTYFVESGLNTTAASESAILSNWSLRDLTKAAQCAGLAVLETLGGFNGEPYNPDTSSDLVMICDRPSA